MRNQPQPLPRDEAMHAYRMAEILGSFTDDVDVTVHYSKRNGEMSVSTGTVSYFNGREGCDTHSVTLDTTATKGRPTTINLHRITEIEGV
jgi:hypothetical protein